MASTLHHTEGPEVALELVIPGRLPVRYTTPLTTLKGCTSRLVEVPLTKGLYQVLDHAFLFEVSG